jgi:diguanylate cyclase (GGDEF)-like protein
MAREIFKSLTNRLIETIKILDNISDKQNLERTLHDIIQSLHDILRCQTCAIIQLNPKTERLEILNSIGLSWQYTKKFRSRPVSRQLRDLIWLGEPVLLRNAESDEQLAGTLGMENSFGSCYFIGLSANQRPLGYLYFDAVQADYFTGDDQLIIQLFSKIVALALLKESLNKQIREQDFKDEETGAISYTSFYERLGEAVSKAGRQQEPLTLLLLDIVKFDRLLTSYGEEICAKFMRELMSTINQQLRTYDYMSKFGTDEIIISMPGHSKEEGYACTKKIYDLINNTEFTTQKLKLDLSVGIANFPENASSAAGLLTAVKNALVESKRKEGGHIFSSTVKFD